MSGSLPYMSPRVGGGVVAGIALVVAVSWTFPLQRKGDRSVERGARAGEEGAGTSTGARRVTKMFVEFDALLASQFHLRRRCIRQWDGGRYVPISVTALTALFFCLF